MALFSFKRTYFDEAKIKRNNIQWLGISIVSIMYV